MYEPMVLNLTWYELHEKNTNIVMHLCLHKNFILCQEHVIFNIKSNYDCTELTTYIVKQSIVEKYVNTIILRMKASYFCTK